MFVVAVRMEDGDFASREFPVEHAQAVVEAFQFLVESRAVCIVR
jgi:hypothetical protein